VRPHRRTAWAERARRVRREVSMRGGFVTGSDFGSMPKARVRISEFGNRLARLVVKAELTDPMSGFFMLTRAAFNGAVRALSGQGYKILVDIFASSSKPLIFREVAFTFRERQHGQSKLDTLIAFEYLQLLLDKLIGHVVPVRFVLFGTIGGLGLVAHLAVLAFLAQNRGTRLHSIAGDGDDRGDDLEFLSQQYFYLSRPAVARLETPLWPALLLRRMRHRRGRQCRHRFLCLHFRSFLVARRRYRRGSRLGVELCHFFGLHLEGR
jgi:hypothetical protein